MEIQRLVNEDSEYPIACSRCPHAPRPHLASHSITTRQPDFTRCVEYGCAQALARILGLPFWQNMPVEAINAEGPAEELPADQPFEGVPLHTHTHPLPIAQKSVEELELPADQPFQRLRRQASEHRLPTAHLLSDTELGLVREPSPQGEMTRRATATERLANNIHGLVTGHADPTPASLAKLILAAIKGCLGSTEEPGERDEDRTAVERLKGFVRDCRDNWDCDADAHKYGTKCRGCEAQRVFEVVWGVDER